MSIQNYVNEKCKNFKTKPKEFWNMVSPYLNEKSKSNDTIQLLEDDKFISEPKEVATFFNNKFMTIADNIGIDSDYYEDISGHPSFDIIGDHLQNTDIFTFKEFNVNEIQRSLVA
jgi:hypothetical protein